MLKLKNCFYSGLGLLFVSITLLAIRMSPRFPFSDGSSYGAGTGMDFLVGIIGYAATYFLFLCFIWHALISYENNNKSLATTEVILASLIMILGNFLYGIGVGYTVYLTFPLSVVLLIAGIIKFIQTVIKINRVGK